MCQACTRRALYELENAFGRCKNDKTGESNLMKGGGATYVAVVWHYLVALRADARIIFFIHTFI